MSAAAAAPVVAVVFLSVWMLVCLVSLVHDVCALHDAIADWARRVRAHWAQCRRDCNGGHD